MGEYQARHTAEKGPYRTADWADPRCGNCGKGGLFIGDSKICAGCEKCLTCRGTGDITLHHWTPGDLLADEEQRPCPTCFPAAWPQGFPGLAFHYGDRSVWNIAPTAPHKNAVDPEAALAESRRRSQLQDATYR